MSQLQEIPIKAPPGVVKTDSLRTIEGRWSDTVNVRFVKLLPQKIGGWIKGYAATTDGTPRTQHAWRDRSFNAYYAASTYKKLYVYDANGAQNDITPYRSTGTLGSNPLSVTNGSNVVQVAHTSHGTSVNDIIEIAGAVAVNGHTWTAGGNAQIDTADSKFGGASLLCDGTGDWVTTPDSADFALGTSDFTTELWFKCNAAGGSDLRLCGQNDAAFSLASRSFYIQRTSGNVIQAQAGDGSTFVTLTGTTQFTNVLNPGWHHVAFVRSGSTFNLFIDGVLEATGTSSLTVTNSSNLLKVGGAGELTISPWNGWIDEFRMSVGVARYTGAFTPPASAFTSDQYTRVLLHFDGVDTSTTITDSAGITPNGTFTVNTVIDADHYTYVFTDVSPVTGSGGGAAVTYKYEIQIGVELGAYGYGWGVGGWGLGTWGTARSTSTVFIEPRVWSMDHFGTLLLATYNGGTLYQFDPTAAQPWPRATLASTDPGMPTNMRAMFVTPERFVMALCDGMQVAWPSQGTINDWTPTLTNTANIRTLTEGTKLVAGRVLTDFVSLVWTDAALYRFQYTGATYIYASSMVGKDCGLVGPNACVTISGIAYWMGQDNFWTYNGVVSPMFNVEDIRKWLFDQIDINLGYQSNAIYVPKNNEIWFFVTPTGETNPTFGVIYSIDQQCWAPLTFGRSGGSHFTQGDTRPFMGDGVTKHIYQHENGLDADGAVLPYSMTLAPYGLTKGGGRSMLVEYIVNDFKDQVGDVTQITTGYDRMDAVSIDSSTDIISATDAEPIDVRVSGRYVGLTLSGSSLGCYVRLGFPVAFVRHLGDRS